MAKKHKLLTQAEEHLASGERPLHAVQGAYETKVMGKDSSRAGVLIATDRRLVFYAKKLAGFDLESFPYENLSSIEQSKGMAGGKVAFFASGNKVSMKWIHDDDLPTFVSYVQSKMGKASPPAASAASSSSVADELSKLAALRDSGVLSDDEFQAQKAKLLR